MAILTEKDIQEGKKISEIFTILSEEKKTQAIVYLSALRDKEAADCENQALSKAEQCKAFGEK
ncbi:MAG: hypothetical protein K2J90_03885 [Lachnospiraceae bacterium]|nr:hypothetical protein [Lachnospiraceae bacterium]MDE6759804.1 hypothetical protein [Lachnospiraceae bacterium]